MVVPHEGIFLEPKWTYLTEPCREGGRLGKSLRDVILKRLSAYTVKEMIQKLIIHSLNYNHR